MAKPTVRVDIVSDTVCPWCYVGKRRLEQAMNKCPDLQFSVHWHPFQLNPNAPAEGVSKLQYYRSKFGPQADLMFPRMQRTYDEVGIGNYSIGGLTGNTFNSHLLIHWAGKTAGWQKQNELVEELMANYFCQEKYINDRDVLLAAVTKVGLDVSQAAHVLDAPGPLAAEVQEELASARRANISGVPFFTINGRYQLSGAQPPEEFLMVFKDIQRTSAAPAGVVEGEACGRDGVCA